ncbi:polysaccharide biosynthesis C-terminal domain-containing protein [soil metagenome]
MKEQIARLGKGTLIYGVGQGLAKLIGFLMLPLLTSYLSPADYGVISILTILSFLAAPVFGLGLANSIAIVYFGHSGTKKEETIWTGFVILLASGTVLLFVFFTFSEAISSLLFQTVDYSDLIRVVGLNTIFNGIINQPFVFRLQFEERSKLYVIITSLCTLTTLVLTILFVVVWENGVWGFMLATLAGSVITFFCYFLAVVKWTKFSTDRVVAIDLVRYGLPMISSFFFLFVLQNAGRFILQRYHGIADVGIYSIGHTFGMVMSLAVTAFTTSWFPYFNSFVDKQDVAKDLFGKITIYYMLAFGGFCLLFFIFSKPLILVLTEPSFHRAYEVVGIISLGNFLVGMDSILMAGVYFKKKAYLMNYVQLGAALTCVLFSFLLIPELDIVGAGLSFLAGYCCLIIFQLVVNRLSGTLRIEYDMKRFFYFLLTTIVVVLISFIPRELTLVQEIIFCSVHAAMLLAVLYLQLAGNERNFINDTIRQGRVGLFKS